MLQVYQQANKASHASEVLASGNKSVAIGG